MRMPSHTTLCSFVFSAILTSAFIPSTGNVAMASAGAPAVQLAVQSALNGMSAHGFAGAAELALPAAPSASPASLPAKAVAANPTLTPELLGKLLQLVARDGFDKEAASDITIALGITAAGQTWPARQFTGPTIDGTIKHAFVISRGSDQDVLLYIRRGDGAHFFRARRDGKLVTAAIFTSSPRQITMRAPEDAQPELESEIAYWAANADELISQK
jgi:hypothetical protein